jgi:hypothetical protein
MTDIEKAGAPVLIREG